MGKQCPKCGHIRQDEGAAPALECPKCGVIYAKAEASLQKGIDQKLQASPPLSRSAANSARVPSFSHIPIQRWQAVLHKDGAALPTEVCQMFGTHGPYLVCGTRLDRLMTLEIVRDASTITSKSKTSGVISTSVTGQIGRGILGNAVAGPVGAIIGASGASKRIETDTTTHQERNVDIYLSLSFKGGESFVVEVFDEVVYKILIACAGQEEWSESQIDAAKREATAYRDWEAGNRARNDRTVILIGKILAVLAALGALYLLVGFGRSKYEEFAIGRLISSGKFDEALQRVKPESAKYKEIEELKTQAAAKVCNEKSMPELRQSALAPTDSTREFYSHCNTVVAAKEPFVENRKTLLIERLGNGSLKTEEDFIGFVNENYPGSQSSYIGEIRVPIGPEWYRLSVAPTVLGGITYYSLISLQPTTRYQLEERDSSSSVGSETSLTQAIKCETVAAVTYANRSQLPPGTTVSDIVQMARSQGKCH